MFTTNATSVPLHLAVFEHFRDGGLTYKVSLAVDV